MLKLLGVRKKGLDHTFLSNLENNYLCKAQGSVYLPLGKKSQCLVPQSNSQVCLGQSSKCCLLPTPQLLADSGAWQDGFRRRWRGSTAVATGGEGLGKGVSSRANCRTAEGCEGHCRRPCHALEACGVVIQRMGPAFPRDTPRGRGALLATVEKLPQHSHGPVADSSF